MNAQVYDTPHFLLHWHFHETRFKDLQGLLWRNSRNVKDLGSFQGISRPWIDHKTKTPL